MVASNFEKSRNAFKAMDGLSAVVHVLKGAFSKVRSQALAKKYSFGERFHVDLPDKLLGLQYASIGNDFRAGRGLWMECFDHYEGSDFSPSLEIGNNCSISRFCHIGCAGNIEIGDNVLIGSNVLITDHGHGDYSMAARENTLLLSPVQRKLKVRTVKIGSNVWIGDSAMILPGADIRNGAVIGAGAVVSGLVPAGQIVVGPRKHEYL